jgi:hypothetical protein
MGASILTKKLSQRDTQSVQRLGEPSFVSPQRWLTCVCTIRQVRLNETKSAVVFEVVSVHHLLQFCPHSPTTPTTDVYGRMRLQPSLWLTCPFWLSPLYLLAWALITPPIPIFSDTPHRTMHSSSCSLRFLATRHL